MKRTQNDDQRAWIFTLLWPPDAVGGVNEIVFAMAEQVRSKGYIPIIATTAWEQMPLPATARGIEVASLRLREPISSSPPHR